MRLVDFCTALEDRVDVAGLRLGGDAVWPLVKLAMRPAYERAYAPTRAGAAVRATPLEKAIAAVRLSIRGRLGDPARNQRVRRASALFASHTTCRERLGDSWYDTFFDPLEDEGVTDRVTFEMIASMDLRQPRYRESVYALPYTTSVAGVERARQLFSHARTRWLADVSRACREILPALDERHLRRKVREYVSRFIFSKVYWARRLDAVQPSRIYIATWYSPEMMALCAEASSRGIPTTDIQHGVQGEHHWMYSGWHPARFGGAIRLMATDFQVWREKERRDLERWCHGTAHSVTVVGSRWLMKDDAFFARHGLQESIARIRSLPTYVVYSQQTLDPRFRPEPLLSFLRERSRDALVVVRMHPAMRRYKQQFANELAAAGIRNVDMDVGNGLPLSILLRHASLHVTYSSSVIIEAGMLGLPSVAFEPACASKYAFEAGSGLLRVLADS